MDRAAFLEAVRAASPKLRKVTVAGLGEVYIRQMTVDEAVRLAADAAVEDEAVSKPVQVIAAMVRDEAGTLLFDRSDKASMAELQAAVGAMDAGVIQSLMHETNRINDPEPGEVDSSGN